jgi:hypothetical protein
MDDPGDLGCQWCGKSFDPRSDGGKAQRFCRPACRRALDAAGRRWMAAALASGGLTIASLRDGPAATRALLPGAAAEGLSPDDAAELLDDVLIALLELPGDTWPDIAVALPEELFDRIDSYIETAILKQH